MVGEKIYTMADMLWHRKALTAGLVCFESLSHSDPTRGEPQSEKHPFFRGPRRYQADDFLYDQGDITRYVYLLTSGMVRRCRVLANGRRQILSFSLPGDIFSMTLNHRYSASAEAVTNTSVVFVERHRLLSLANSDSGVAQALLEVMMRDHDDMQEHVLSITRSAESRLARFLLRYSARLHCPPQFSLPMTLRDIADYLGLTLETVSRTLNGLKCSGMIERAGPRQISLRDRAALECLAE
jgi:CRP-like cAMP-binding protein